ncbi:MAG: glycosyltransferase, partial [Thermodesulfobacteriota bacterium]
MGDKVVRGYRNRGSDMTPCPICESTDTTLVSVMKSVCTGSLDEEFTLYRCRMCDSAFFRPFPRDNYAESLNVYADRFEIEHTAGVLFMASLIYPLRAVPIKNSLDIGCGLGFLTDIARETLGIERTLGIEPGKRPKIFDHEVINGYFPGCLDNKGEPFDLILSSEVLEHTHSPSEFLQGIVSSLGKNGVAVLTTPNANGYFKIDCATEKRLTAGPGGHTILFSPKSVTMLLDNMGVHHRIFFSEGASGDKHMIVYLSRDADLLSRINYLRPTTPEVIDFLDGYLWNTIKKIEGRPGERKKWLYFGYLFRLIELRVNRGNYRACEKIMDDMIAGLESFYRIKISNLEPGINEMDAEDISFDGFMERFPAFLGRFLYFHGLYLMNHKREFNSAHRAFKAACNVLELGQNFPFFFADREIMKLSNNNKRLARRLASTEGLPPGLSTAGRGLVKLIDLAGHIDRPTLKKAVYYLKTYGLKRFMERTLGKVFVDTRLREVMLTIASIPFLINKQSIGKVRAYLKVFGLKITWRKIVGKIEGTAGRKTEERLYQSWIKKQEPNEDGLKVQRNKKFEYEPKVSVVVPTFNTPARFLIEMLESVLSQTYSNWELCIADGRSAGGHVREILEEYAGMDSRIKVAFLDENRGIAGNSNAALSLATGDFVALMDHDDILPPFALFEVVKAANENPEVDFIYSDEDNISTDGKERSNPHFKPDFSPDLLRSCNYITHLSVIRKKSIDDVGGFREGYDGSQDYDLILRVTERARKVVHIPKVLYYWRRSPSSVSDNPWSKMYAYENAKKALADHLERSGLEGDVEHASFLGAYRTTYKIKNNPRISIIIPSRDHAEELKRCVGSILDKSTYRNFEIIIVENGSREEKTFEFYRELKSSGNIQVVEWDRPFNYSAINNHAIEFSSGDFILFLNNDTAVISPDWLERMLEHASREEVGAVGAKLYYPDKTVQHAGLILWRGGLLGHSHRYSPMTSQGYHGRLSVVQNLSAVTGACLMVRKEIFNAVVGFDNEFTW